MFRRPADYTPEHIRALRSSCRNSTQAAPLYGILLLFVCATLAVANRSFHVPRAANITVFLAAAAVFLLDLLNIAWTRRKLKHIERYLADQEENKKVSG